MGPFMVEIVFCRVTRRGRKTKKGMNKIGIENMRNDGPAFSFVPPEDTVKFTLDLSENGPVFSALDDMMMKMMDDENESSGKKKNKAGGGGGGEAKKALKSLLKSGIPGIEKMFTPGSGKGTSPQKGFHKMNAGSKKKFMNAIFGEDGTAIDSGTAAALLAATCSGGDPEIGEKIAQLLVPEMDSKVDPSMMAALMSASSMINAGANTEEVLKAMKMELTQTGMPEEEILRKTKILMKAFGKEETSNLAEYSLICKQTNTALRKIDVSPKEFAQIVLVHKVIAACGSTPHNVAKVIMIENQLSKRGAQSKHICDALLKLVDTSGKLKSDAISRISSSLSDDKLRKDDVRNVVMCHEALENENEPTWKEVKMMKDILQGASPNSPEAIGLNLARATKTAGLTKADLTNVLIAQKALAALNVDPIALAKVMHIEKTIVENGVPAAEIARVLGDGSVPKEVYNTISQQIVSVLPNELNANDVDSMIKLYDNLRLKSNIPLEVVEHIDKTLIQVRCSLEDVADNMVSAMVARGEKEVNVMRSLCNTLKNTGATCEITGTTMMSSMKKVASSNKLDADIMRETGRALNEEFDKQDVIKAMSEMLNNCLDEHPECREEAIKATEVVLKESGGFPDEIRKLMTEIVPPEPPPRSPTPPEEVKDATDLCAVGEDGVNLSETSGEIDPSQVQASGTTSVGGVAQAVKGQKKISGKKIDTTSVEGAGIPQSPAIMVAKNDSRRGSFLGPGTPLGGSRRGSARVGLGVDSVSLAGTERRGSFYGEDVSKRSSVAIVVDNAENKLTMAKALEEVFTDDQGSDISSKLEVMSPAQVADLASNLLEDEGSDLDPAEAENIREALRSGDPEALKFVLQKAEAKKSATETHSNTLTHEQNNILPGGLTSQELQKLLGAFDTAGVIHNIGGITKFRTLQDMKDTIKMTSEAFDAAIVKAKKQTEIPGLSPECRLLMEAILNKANADRDEVGSRVTALLAGTSLRTTSGIKKKYHSAIPEVLYTIDDDGKSRIPSRLRELQRLTCSIPRSVVLAGYPPTLNKKKVDTSLSDNSNNINTFRPMEPSVPASIFEDHDLVAAKHRSIKRQAELLHRRQRHMSGQEPNTEDKNITVKQIIGLRRAKVPLMVYSCGGFTRCFRIARYYNPDGPPIGIAYKQKKEDNV